MKRANATWLEQLPKIELHLHLEGAIPLPSLWRLIQKYGGDPTVTSFEELEGKFVYKDFPHFIETWIWKNQFLREYEDFTYIAEAVAKDLERQGIVYAEVFYTPTAFIRHGLRTQEVTAAIRQGLERMPEVGVALIADFARDNGPECAVRDFQQIREVKELGVIGIGIGGSEHACPPEPFAELYEQARDAGFHTTAHAGEAAGAESIWGAIRSLKAERIGHGTRAFEDPALVDHLAAAQVPLEMCPGSNVKTGVVRSLCQHPICDYLNRGLLITVNSDDPKMFGTDLSSEYRALVDVLKFSETEIYQLILNAVTASWASAETKARLRRLLAPHKPAR